jgi:hypothetical protein
VTGNTSPRHEIVERQPLDAMRDSLPKTLSSH